jgi:hypothetical protein
MLDLASSTKTCAPQRASRQSKCCLPHVFALSGLTSYQLASECKAFTAGRWLLITSSAGGS